MDWVILEVVIGLSFLFFLFSIVASAVNEGISGIFELRARTLEKGIVNLVTGSTRTTGGDLEIVRRLYRHSLINSYTKDNKKPSYLSSRSFRNALLDITGLLEATEQPKGDPLPIEQIRAEVEAKIGAVPNENLRDSLTTIWRSAERDATEFRAGVERWFDRGMERVSGWYKRQAQLMLFVIGLAIAVLINASALNAADRLWTDDGLRRGLLEQVENQPSGTTGTEALERLEQLRFPIGWQESNRPDGLDGWLVVLFGWLFTGIAVTFGAPFWFDLLGRVSNLRAAGRKPDSVLAPFS